MNMNSDISKYEKSIEECVRYNFDDNSPKIKSKKRIGRPKSKIRKLNEDVNNLSINWLTFKDNNSWLYICNGNPNCSFCEQAFNETPEMVESCWTNSETQFVNDDPLLSEEEIIKIHTQSKNHILAYQFMLENSLIDNKDKVEKENKKIEFNVCDVPEFVPSVEWVELKATFPWLYFKDNLFRCLICEEGFVKDHKSMFPTQWTCPDRIKQLKGPSQKSLRSVARFEKHQLTINHMRGIEIVKSHSSMSDPKLFEPLISPPIKLIEETKPIPRKSMIVTAPNVTTRTAIRKSLCDKNSAPDYLDGDSWNCYKKEFPWIYCMNNILRCNYCEDAYKEHSGAMLSTLWTCPDINANYDSTNHSLKSKSRLIRHENTKNHDLATKYLSILKPNIAAEIQSVQIENESKIEVEEPIVVAEVIEDLRVPTTVRASRKSAPVKLTNLSYEENQNSHEKSSDKVQNYLNSSQKVVKKSTDISTEENVQIPYFMNEEQYSSMTTRYPWFYYKDKFYGCLSCLEASKIKPESMSKTKFTTGLDELEDDLTLNIFRKKLYRHNESKTHNTGSNIVKKGVSETPIENEITTIDISSSDSRFTRLKSGSRSKIDYKRMSEGLMETVDDKITSDNQSVQEKVIPVVVEKKRKESSSSWMCPQCKSHFSNTDDLIQHISLCDYQPSDSTKILACPCNPQICRFNTITKLDLHAAQEHDTQSYFHCYICSDRYHRLSSLYHHMLINHLISWDPFEAYLPMKPSEPFLCLFCSVDHHSNMLLTKHYCHSNCNIHLQTCVVLQDISPSINVSEEVTILDVDELPEEKEEVIYSPIRKARNQHNQISRNHPLRRFGHLKKTNSKEQTKKTKEPPKKLSLENNEDNCKVEESEKIEGKIESFVPLNIEKQSIKLKEVELTITELSYGPLEIVELLIDQAVSCSEQKNDNSDHPSINDTSNSINSQSNIIQTNKSNLSRNNTVSQSDNVDELINNIQLSDSSEALLIQVVDKKIENVKFHQSNKEYTNKLMNESLIENNNEKILASTKETSNTTTNESNKKSTNKNSSNLTNQDANKSTNENTINSTNEINDETIKEPINESNSSNKARHSKKDKLVKLSNDIKSGKQNKPIETSEPESQMKSKRIIRKSKYDEYVLDSKLNENSLKSKRGRPSKKMKTDKVLTKTPTKVIGSEMYEMSQVVDLNEIIRENKKLTVEVKNSASPTKLIASTPKPMSTNTPTLPQPSPKQEPSKFNKKIPIRIQSQLSPCKKLKTIDRTEDVIPSGLSFMDRMKKIRQLKKIRTEKQREEMMAVDEKIAEINERFYGPSFIAKVNNTIKSTNNESHSLTNTKPLTHHIDNKSKAEKRKTSTPNHHAATPKQVKIDLPKPINSPTKSEVFECDVCQLKFRSLRARDNHTTTDHKGLKLFCCKSCELSFTTHILLRKHAQKYHSNGVSYAVFGDKNTEELLIPCSICHLHFTSRSGLNHHITSNHKVDNSLDNGLVLDEFINKLIIADPKYSPQSCLICQEIMDNEFELDIHTIEHQKECLTTEIEPTQFACPKCCRLFFGRDGKSYLKDHYNITHLEKSAPSCEECDTKFTSTVCYSLHRKTVKNCSKKTAEQLKIDDPYEKLNDPMKLAFVCSRCQTLVAGESAESRFSQHQAECQTSSSQNDELLISHTHNITTPTAIITTSDCVEAVDN